MVLRRTENPAATGLEKSHLEQSVIKNEFLFVIVNGQSAAGAL